jgi:hypothetical protein
MKIRYLLVVLLLCGNATAAAPEVTIIASGTFYFELDGASEKGPFESVNFAFFVPEAKSLSKFPAVTSGDFASPVKYISFEPADEVFETVVGRTNARRILRGSQPIIQVPVTLKAHDFGSEIECDSRVYHATLVSAKTWRPYYAATLSDFPHGC